MDVKLKKTYIAIFFCIIGATTLFSLVEASDKDEFLAKINQKNISVLKSRGYDLEKVELKSTPDLYKIKRKNVGVLSRFTEPLYIKEKNERRKYSVSSHDDPSYGSQWNLPTIKAHEAWDAGATGSTSVTVAVLDTGICVGLGNCPVHEEFTGRLWTNPADPIGGGDDNGNGKIDDTYGWDFVETGGDNNPAPDDGGGGDGDLVHGTLVTGVIAANSNNALGIAGIDQSTKIMTLRVMDNNGDGWTDDIAEAIEYSADNGADVINMSLGYYYSLGPDTVLENAINYAYNAGVTLVAAAGNDNDGVNYPAASPNVIAVGATDSLDRRIDPSLGHSWGSCYGPELDVVAPGTSIPTTTISWSSGAYTTNEYGSTGGTSLASPHVAALASLIKASNLTMTPSVVEQVIINNADKVSGMGGQERTDYYGYGRINIYDSLYLYDYNLLSSVNPPAFMVPNETAFVQIHLTNIGGATWYNETSANPMRLAVINADGQNFWPNNDTWVGNDRIAMTSPSAGSGEVGSFNFTIKAPTTPGSHTLKFMPVVEGVQALRDIGMQFSTNISYDYDIISAVNPPSSMTGGDTAFVQVHLRNTGGSTWYNETSANPMRLAVLNADGQNFWPNNDTWVGNDRIAMTSPSVPPGGIGSFNFTVKAPTTPGNHTMQFMPVIEGVQALRDIGMQFVVSINYDYDIISAVNPPSSMTGGDTAFVQVHLINTGGSTWYNETSANPMRLAVINADGQNFWPNNDTWVDNVRIAMTTPRVAPGEVGSFNFTIKAPSAPGAHTLKFMPVVEGVQALRDIGMQFVVVSQ